MKFVITGKNIEVTEALRARIFEKIGRLDKFFHSEPEVHATMTVQKTNHLIEVTIPFNRMIFKAVESNDDMYASIDKVVDSLERQIVKNKSRITRKHQESKYKHSEREWGVSADEPVDVKYIKAKRNAVKPMSVDEAVMQLNILEHDFLMFMNSDSNEINVLYKRKDGHLGLIEPQEE